MEGSSRLCFWRTVCRGRKCAADGWQEQGSNCGAGVSGRHTGTAFAWFRNRYFGIACDIPHYFGLRRMLPTAIPHSRRRGGKNEAWKIGSPDTLAFAGRRHRRLRGPDHGIGIDGTRIGRRGGALLAVAVRREEGRGGAVRGE